MDTVVEKPNATRITVTARVPHAELEPSLPKAAAAISEEVEIEGFRRGKAPYEVVRQKVGEFKLLEEAARRYIADNFKRILADIEDREYKGKSFEPVGEPQVTITKLAPGEELEFKISLTLLPAVELPDYRAIARRVLATKKVPETTEQEVADAVAWLRESRAKLVTVRRPARTGDRVEVDFSASAGGVKLEGGESRNHPFILGRGRSVPGFEEALVGMKADEEKAFTLAVPPDWRERRIAGQAVDFRAKVNLVQEREVPDWDDAFARSLGTFDSAAAAAASVRQGLRAEKEEKERERVRMAMAEAIAAETGAEIPEALIGRELGKMLAELEASIGGMGLKFPDYLGHIGKTPDDLRREWRDDAQRRVKIALVLREISRREGIRPSEEEVEEVKEAVGRSVAHRGMGGEDLKTLDREALVGYHVGVARNEKVFQWLESQSS